MGAVQQLLFQVEWGELDVMVIDMPPGTGDAHLTVTQRVPVSGNTSLHEISFSFFLNCFISFDLLMY
jgi:Mrp family chromosome partitioning ATPase